MLLIFFRLKYWRREDEIIKKSRIFCVASKWMDMNFGGKEILRGYFDRFLDGIFGTWYEIYSRGWIVRKGDITGFLIISIRIVNISFGTMPAIVVSPLEIHPKYPLTIYILVFQDHWNWRRIIIENDSYARFISSITRL